MELVIRAHSNEAVMQPLVARFDERGGTIGRSETNTLTLPDPNRHISRLQAEVAFNAGAFSIRNVGSANALLVGGRPVAPGESVAMGHGDELAIGSYVLRVSVDGRVGETTQANVARQAIDPRSVIKASLKESRTNPRLRAGALPAAVPAAPRTPSAAPGPDPFADLFSAAPAASGADPFADLLGAAPPAAIAAPVSKPVARPPARLPDDFDPFAELPRPRRSEPKPAEAAARSAGFGDLLGPAAASASLDQAFDLGPASRADPLADFLAAPSPQAATRQAVGSDPLAHFGAAEPANSAQVAPAAFDHVPELQAAYAPPAVVSATGTAPRTLPAPPPDSAAPQLAAAAAASAPVPESASADSQAASNEDLWRAFCEGAGIPAGQPRTLDAAVMRQLGQVLHQAVDGSLKLIAARATVKQELRADVTLIQARNNNPLKFSPDAPAAIEQLLRAPLRGFMPGPAAMQDAMADLLGHAMGTMAGMRAALHGVLQRFEPAQLEHKLAAHKVLDALLPMNRRAKLWEQYLLHFERIRNDAQEDFHELFGKAFVEAYEEQLGKLKAERR